MRSGAKARCRKNSRGTSAPASNASSPPLQRPRRRGDPVVWAAPSPIIYTRRRRALSRPVTAARCDTPANYRILHGVCAAPEVGTPHVLAGLPKGRTECSRHKPSGCLRNGAAARSRRWQGHHGLTTAPNRGTRDGRGAKARRISLDLNRRRRRGTLAGTCEQVAALAMAATKSTSQDRGIAVAVGSAATPLNTTRRPDARVA
jgi:hypothetical protein